MKTVIWPKPCSRYSGSTIYKCQTLQKSVQRLTPNSNGTRKRKTSLPAPSPDALFRPRARFQSILGSRPDPKIGPRPVPKSTPQVLFRVRRSTFCVVFARVRSGRVPNRIRRLRGPVQSGFREDFFGFRSNFWTFVSAFLRVGSLAS